MYLLKNADFTYSNVEAIFSTFAGTQTLNFKVKTKSLKYFIYVI